MAYLSNPTSKSDYGVVQVGNNILVDADGIISLEQDLSSTATVVFSTISANSAVFDRSQRVVTKVTPSAGVGIAITGVVSTGTSTSFTVANTGVLSLTAGPGISLSTSTGNITVTSAGVFFVNTTGTTSTYTATLSDEYIGVRSAASVTINLPSGVNGRYYTIKDEYGQGSGKITVAPTLPDLIDNAATYIIRQYEHLKPCPSGHG